MKDECGLRIIALFFSGKGGVVQSLERERTDVRKHRDECELDNNCFFVGEKVVRIASMCSEFWFDYLLSTRKL